MKRPSERAPLGIDLLQDRVSLASCPHSHGEEDAPTRTSTSLIPSALLPLYPGEKGIFGVDALEHRRAKGRPWPNECRLYWNDQQSNGCGRVPLVAALSRSIAVHRTWGRDGDEGRQSDHFGWRPHERVLSLRGPDIVCSTIKQMAMMADADALALALPDSSDEGVQQALLNAFAGSLSSAGRSLHLLRRSMAQAMRWCHDNQQKVRTMCPPCHGQYAGHLLVVNMALDIWEARLVPLQWQRHGRDDYLVPVDSERWPRRDLSVCGWEVAQRWLASRHGTDQPDALWNHLLGQRSLQELLSTDVLRPRDWAMFSHRAVPMLPHCDALYGRLWPSYLDLDQGLCELSAQKARLEEGAQQRLAVVVDGCYAWSVDCQALFPSLYNPSSVSRTLYRPVRGHSLAAEGAALYVRRLQEGLPTYLQEIVPIEIWCRNTARDGAEFIWKPLTDNETLAAGRSYSDKRCTGFILGAGTRTLSLTLCRPLYERDADYEYRTIEARIHEQFTENRDITIDVSVKPGAGYAKARIITDNGHLLSQLDWAAMRPCAKPEERNQGYLAKVCEARSDPYKWGAIARLATRHKLDQLLGKGVSTERLQAALDVVAPALKQSGVKQDKKDIFCEWRAVSSEGTVNDKEECLTTIAAFLEACYLRAQRLDDSEMSKLALQGLRQLFTAIPPLCRGLWATHLLRGQSFTMYQLLCIGHAFASPEEIRAYYQAFCQAMNNGAKSTYYWLQALGSILRYRYSALDPQYVDDELFACLWDTVVTQLRTHTRGKLKPNIALSAIRSLNYLLGRRRFDKSFMAVGSAGNQQLNDLLQRLSKRIDLSQLFMRQLEQLQKLLAYNASEADIQLLLSSEYGADDD